MHRGKLVLAAALALTWQSAQAHIVFEDTDAVAGSYFASALRVSHGCDGAPTTAITVEVPPQIVMIKPQPKPGWTLTIAREPLSDPVTGEGGKRITERVARITWSGGLADDMFDTFGLMMKLPAQTGMLYFPVQQTCAIGETDWSEIPAAGAPWHSVPHPAPVLDVMAPDMAGPAHH